MFEYTCTYRYKHRDQIYINININKHVPFRLCDALAHTYTYFMLLTVFSPFFPPLHPPLFFITLFTKYASNYIPKLPALSLTPSVYRPWPNFLGGTTALMFWREVRNYVDAGLTSGRWQVAGGRWACGCIPITIT